ncbi:MAG: Hint domain-containing protein, partial [Loktanella sp.]|nr:Hint domain-containing protein [Loktanella sp.]
AGADEIYGGLGDDSVNGGDGNDLIYGDAGADVLEGGDGNDIIFGGDGSDDISGGDGDDTLHGDLGDDTLYGGAGADVLFGGAGTNTLDGGADQDTFVITDDSGSNIITGGETGDDLDTVDMAAVSDNVTVTFDAAESGSAEHGTNTTTFSEIEAVTTGTGDDTVTGVAGDVTISTGAGDDIIDVGAGNQVIYAGEGNDSISTGTGDDIIFGGDGDDTIDGGLGADWIDAGAGNDTITFSDGDTLFGGDGDDTFNYADLGEPTDGTIFISGGSDDETPGGGDTLNLGKNADWSTLDVTDDGSGSFGARDIASLRPGDFVVTRDHGMQPIRWIESRTVPARGRFAPIRITPGVVTGLERDLLVSPQHRMLFQGFRAELLFGESEVLAAAKHLVDGVSVTQEESDTVTYVHMMFDQHEIVFAEGAATESFHPGDLSITAISDPAREELFAIFPELRSHLGAYGQTARRCLKRHETELLLV